MNSTKIKGIVAAGNVGKDPYIEVTDDAGATHRIVFDAAQTSNIVTAFAMAGDRMIKRIAKEKPDMTFVPVSLPCQEATAGGSRSKPEVFSLSVTLAQGPELSFELPVERMSHLITALKGTEEILTASVKKRLN